MGFDLSEVMINKGPKGGNLDNPVFNPERRRASLNAKPNETGLPGLHKYEDVTRQGLKNEQPWHRMAAFMLLAGRTNSEIAMSANVGVMEVSILRSQRWFQELLATLANEAGQDVMGVLASETLASIEKVVALRDGAESERVQLAAAQLLIEQSNGKAVQKVVSVTSHSVYKSPSEEHHALIEELHNLRQTNSKFLQPPPEVGTTQ